MLPFRSKGHLDNWLKRRGLKSGYDMSIQACWELAQKWYAGRLEHDWKRPDREKTQDLFESLGLEGEFWNLK
jgi:hypothetical protein